MTDETTEAVARAVAAERARCAARVRDVGEKWSGLRQTATTRAALAVINAARRGIESGDTGADPDVVLTAVARLTRERDEARAAIRADLHCDECGAVATRSHHEPARKHGGDDYACDVHSVATEASDGHWTDLPHAAAARAARVP